MAIETYSISMLPPAEMSIDILGSAIEGGRSLNGDTNAIDFTGGGRWSVKYQRIPVFVPAQHRYWQRLRNILNGSVRTMIVPMLTDYVAPYPLGTDGEPMLPIGGITYSDGALFSDLVGFSQGNIDAVLVGAHALNAGTLTFQVINGSRLEGGETFSFLHETKNFRAYGIADIDSITPEDTTDGQNVTYVVAIRPTLREAVADGTPLDFYRPRCLMRLEAGTSLPWEPFGWYQGAPSISFVEAG
jgi:hypothetical protein